MKNGQLVAKNQAEEKANAAVTTQGTPIVIQPVAELGAPLVVINSEAIAEAKAFQDRIAQMTAHDKASADALGLVAKEARALFNRIDANREKVKKPVLDLGRLIDTEAKKALDPLAAAAKDADAKVKAWLNAENERLEKERKEQEALAEAAAKRRREEEAKEAEAREKANQAIRDQAAAEERAANAKSKAAREKAQREADALAEQVLKEQKAAEEAERQKELAAVDQRVAEQQADSVEGPGKVAGYRQKDEAPWAIPDFTKIPPALLEVVLQTNNKVIEGMIKTGALNETKHGAWLQIKRTTGVARSK
jgi:flagellar biosynthesis GTPase FlhF